MLTDDGPHTVEHIAVLGVIRQLIVNQLCLNRFLRGHDEDGFRSAGSEAAQKVVSFAFLSQNTSLHECVGTESDVVLGYGEEKEGAISTVEPEDAALSPSLLNGAHHTKLVDLRVQLHHSLSVLGGEGTSDLDCTSDTTYSIRC